MSKSDAMALADRLESASATPESGNSLSSRMSALCKQADELSKLGPIAAATIRQQAAEIERLAARVRELEAADHVRRMRSTWHQLPAPPAQQAKEST